MASSNLHYHFKTKQDLLLALLSEIQDRFDGKREAVMDRPARNLRERLEVFFRQKRDFILQVPGMTRCSLTIGSWVSRTRQ